MKIRFVYFILLIVVVAACGGGGGGSSSASEEGVGASGGSSGAGNSNANTSHRAGQNCLNSGCHDGSDSSADEFFSAGTVYLSSGAAQTNATVRLYIHNTNTLAAEMETDDSGNFYTTEIVDGLSINGEIVSGVDVEVEGANNAMRSMPGLVTNGGCNSCHGDSVARITAN